MKSGQTMGGRDGNEEGSEGTWACDEHLKVLISGQTPYTLSLSLTQTHHLLRNIYSRYQSINDLLSTCIHTKSQQSCPILCDPMDCGLPVSSVHGILQARITEWVTMPCYRGSSLPGD